DCSLQRRHQKVIEEAPAPGMDEATREEICAAAVRAAKAVDYEGAGTIEFIADASEGLRADRIFFMEMNTRLQVEHPVTEEITGVDLVEWQLRVASGEAIPLKQDELSIDGHAIEARLYAEDPAKGFLPSTGRLEHLVLPHPTGIDARIETGVAECSEISPFYDPMIAKLVVAADTREDAVSDLAEVCAGVEIWPVRSNAGFLKRALDIEEFKKGDVTTAFIATHEEALLDNSALRASLKRDAAATMIARELSAIETVYGTLRDEIENPRHEVWQGALGFRLNAPNKNSVAFSFDGEPTETVAQARDWLDRYTSSESTEGGVVVFDGGEAFLVCTRIDGSGSASAADGAILAPMPGKVIAVDVSEGDAVTVGQRLMVLEAMKMEHALTAPFDGTVTGLEASEGGQVQVEAVLCVVEPAE
ncbi:MAG: biotin/lipoyl-containing protein, partial [Pseudomonadota bacterium]